ncbi:DUF4097 family beta strand repeat-containing protein [Sciscionella sediminilitoris]|uniref:DUF4097 family beta strand repeat-containing protein n=1 Tax=Sciscionella sediminilitoris TaxID=1445613 RepID=UPI0004DF1FB6|nr:DUF4097 family beta strand repeat-containing protein [Sciscionella sp. SE31]
MRRIVLACGGLALLGVALALFLGNPSSWFHGFGVDKVTRSSQDITERVARVDLDVPTGDVQLHGTNDGKTRIVRELRYWGDKPSDQTYRLAGDALRLGGCGDNCTVNYRVYLPRGLPVGGRLGSGNMLANAVGDVRLDNSSGDMRFTDVKSAQLTVGSGNVTVTKDAGAANVRSSSGEVELRDIGGRADVHAGSGNVTARGMHGPVKVGNSSGEVAVQSVAVSNVDVDTGSGNVNIRVPNAPYQVHTEDNDRTRVDVPNTASAPNSITVRSGSGDVSVAKS